MKKLGVKSLTLFGLLSLFLFTGVVSVSCSRSTMPKKKTKNSYTIKSNYRIKGTNKPRK